MRVTQGRMTISGKGEARSQAPQPSPSAYTASRSLWEGKLLPEALRPVSLLPLRIISFLRSDNAAHPTHTSLHPQRLQARIVLCSQGHEQGMSPAPRALGSHTHHGTGSLGDRHMHLGQVQTPIHRTFTSPGTFLEASSTRPVLGVL